VIGEIAALGCAPLWAISSILLKSQTDKVDALQINAIRGLFAAAFAVAIFLITGGIDQFSSLPLSAVIYLLLAAIVGFVAGDTLYIKGMGIIGVSRALPMSITYPIFVLPFSVTIGGESLSFLTVAGVFIAAMGLHLITAPQRRSEREKATQKWHWWGTSLILAASLCWAIGTVLLGFAMTSLSPILAGAIRMPFMALVLFMMVYLRKSTVKVWSQGFSSLAILALAGIMGIGVGGLLFMIGVKHAGAAKTAILSSTAPLFGVPLSMLILHEKITLKIVFGTILCVIGVCLLFSAPGRTL
jgi:DME family drug/metabolite transporter